MNSEGLRPIEMSLKEVTVSDKDTKDGQTKMHKVVFKGNMGDVEVGFTMKTENKQALDDLISLKLGTPMFLKIVPDPQTTLGDIEEKEQQDTANKEGKKKDKKKAKPKKEDIIYQEPGIIDAEHRLVGPKELAAGDDGNVLDELKG